MPDLCMHAACNERQEWRFCEMPHLQGCASWEPPAAAGGLYCLGRCHAGREAPPDSCPAPLSVRACCLVGRYEMRSAILGPCSAW